MGNLRDQLKKAKILSEKEARRLAHEERVERKELGREGLEKQDTERRAEIDRLRDEERQRTRAAQEELDRERRDAAERSACQDVLRNDVVRPHARGQQRWYFELDDGRLPWLEVDEKLRFELQSGTYWIVRTGVPASHAYGLLPADLGRRVGAALPDVVAWSPGGAHRKA